MILRYAFALICLLFADLIRAQINLSYEATTPGGAKFVMDNYLGISLELGVVNTLIGNSPQTIPAPIQNYLRNIRSRMANPLRLRMGGNTMDVSFYIPTQAEMILPNGTIVNPHEFPVTYGPILLDTMVQLGDLVGGAQWFVGLGLSNTRDNNTVTFAATAMQKLGNRLDAFLLGNEPDLYLDHGKRVGIQNYTVQNYIDDYAYVLGQMHGAGGSLLNAPMGGPTICCHWDLDSLLSYGYVGAFGKFLKYITLQHYPQNNCGGAPLQYGLNYYIAHLNAVNMARWNLPGITAANTAGYSVSMSEFNSASCGGAPGISDTFGSAMWAIDYSLQLASLGYGSSYIHTREAGISYNLFEPPPAGVDPSNSWSTGPSYHSVLVVAEALHNPKAPWAPVAVVDLNADNSMLSPQSTVAAYAIYPSPDPNNARKPPIRFLLFNYALNGSTTFQYVPPPLSEGQTWTNSVNVKYLTAESVTARFNISWAGQILSGEGKMTGNLATTSVPCNQTESCAIPVPGPGVALVFLDGGDLLEDSNGTSTGGNNGGNENTSGGGGGGTGQDPNQEGSGTVGGNNGEMDIRLSWWTAILGISLALAASLTSLLP